MIFDGPNLDIPFTKIEHNYVTNYTVSFETTCMFSLSNITFLLWMKGILLYYTAFIETVKAHPRNRISIFFLISHTHMHADVKTFPQK